MGGRSNNHKIVKISQMLIFKWRFRCCCLSFPMLPAFEGQRIIKSLYLYFKFFCYYVIITLNKLKLETWVEGIYCCCCCFFFSRQVKLNHLFQDLLIDRLQSTSLTLLHEYQDLDPSSPLNVKPMELYSYKMRLTWHFWLWNMHLELYKIWIRLGLFRNIYL